MEALGLPAVCTIQLNLREAGPSRKPGVGAGSLDRGPFPVHWGCSEPGRKSPEAITALERLNLATLTYLSARGVHGV